MQSLKMLLRFLSMVTIVSLLPVVLGAVVWGGAGAWGGLIFSLVFIASIALATEKLIAQTYDAHSKIPAGLRRSLDLVLEESGRDFARILIYPNPLPNALVVRRIGGHGSILISQGLVALLSEGELRKVLKMCLARLEEPTLVFQSLNSVFAVGVLGLVPRSWFKLVFGGRLPDNLEKTELGPFSTLIFLILFPVVQFFLNAGAVPPSSKTRAVAGRSPISIDQKIGSLIPLFGGRKNYGTSSLNVIP